MRLQNRYVGSLPGLSLLHAAQYSIKKLLHVDEVFPQCSPSQCSSGTCLTEEAFHVMLAGMAGMAA